MPKRKAEGIHTGCLLLYLHADCFTGERIPFYIGLLFLFVFIFCRSDFLCAPCPPALSCFASSFLIYSLIFSLIEFNSRFSTELHSIFAS